MRPIRFRRTTLRLLVIARARDCLEPAGLGHLSDHRVRTAGHELAARMGSVATQGRSVGRTRAYAPKDFVATAGEKYVGNHDVEAEVHSVQSCMEGDQKEDPY